MPRFQNERTIQRRLWKSMIFMTIIVCSIFLYSSFIYQGRNKLSNEAYSQTVSSVLAQSQCPEKCLTKECIQNANYFLGSINPDVNPCDNFYSFACGSYIQKVGKSENHSVISDMKLSMKNTIADMLQNVNGSANSSAEKMKTVFESCMSFTASEINAMQTISEFLNRLGLGDWPHLPDDFYFNSPTLEETLAILEAHDEYAFLIFQAQRKSESPDSLSLLHVSVKGNSESNSSYIDGYEDIVKKTLRYHKMNENKISEEWESFKTIEKDIYDASLANKLFFDVYGVENKNASTTESAVNDTTASQIAVNKVKEAEKNLTDYGRNYEPKLWGCAETESDNVTFICNILKFFITHTGLENEFTKKFVLVQEADEVFGLYSILKNYTHRSIANFLALRFFIRHMKEMNVYFRSMKYHVIKDGSLGYSHFFARHPQNKREHCASWMAVAMSEPLALLYISDIMPLEVREDINDMFKNFLIKAGNYTVEQEWIDNSTKRAFHELHKILDKMEIHNTALI
ncbi:neprilysin-21 [Parasteatoda tepidariorum]|nr:neprilysin-21 [Parasteatoda tepidariorum]